MTFRKVLSGLQKELQNKYEISSTIQHRGEKGRKREAGLSGFLREYLPEAYGVGTGEIIFSASESPSPQCDIIIYDRLKTFIIGKYDAIQQIPIEGVYAVVEVKSIINTYALRDAFLKFSKIRKLCDQSFGEEKNGYRKNPEYFLFGYHLKASYGTCKKVIKESGKEDITIVSLDSGFSAWVGDDNAEEPRLVWVEGTNKECNIYETLAYFFLAILEACDAYLGEFDHKTMWQYLIP